MRVPMTKHQGLGNDFLVVFRPCVESLPQLAQLLCDRRRGIGADGLLVGEPERGYAARMVLFNADGSRAEMSGNGIRCFAQAVAARRGRLSNLNIMTDAGHRYVELEATDRDDTVNAVVSMGEVERLEEPRDWALLGCHPDRPVAHLGLGNPHSVVAVDDVFAVDLDQLGARVPQVNLEIVAPGEHAHEVRMRVHERGVGVTEACGTGACAAAFAAADWGLATPVDGVIHVHMDGGSVEVRLDSPESGHLQLVGPSTFIADFEIDTTLMGIE